MNILNLAKLSNSLYHNDSKYLTLIKNYSDTNGIFELGDYKFALTLKDDLLLITIRGSANANNWKDNIKNAQSIDEGFVLMLHKLYEEIDFGSVKGVLVNGHSLGGSIAIKLGNYIKESNSSLDVKVIAFEPMKPYKSKHRASADIVFTNNSADIVPLYPLRNHHCGKQLFFNKKGSLVKYKWRIKLLNMLKGLYRRNLGVYESHRMEEIFRILKLNEKELRRRDLWSC